MACYCRSTISNHKAQNNYRSLGGFTALSFVGEAPEPEEPVAESESDEDPEDDGDDGDEEDEDGDEEGDSERFLFLSTTGNS